MAAPSLSRAALGAPRILGGPGGGRAPVRAWSTGTPPVGPPQGGESPGTPPGPPGQEEEEEEEEEEEPPPHRRGLPGGLRGRALLVDESCRR